MCQELVLDLRLAGQSPGRLELVLAVRNVSAGRVLIPEPEETGLVFTRVGDGAEAEWGTRTLQSGRWRGAVLEAGAAREFSFSAVTVDALTAEERDPMSRDYRRWTIDLRAGEYEVDYRLSVGEDYFEPDSHCTFPDLLRVAEGQGAAAWRGAVVSNRLRVVHV